MSNEAQLQPRRFKVLRMSPAVVLALLQAPTVEEHEDGSLRICTYAFKDKQVAEAKVHHVYYEHRSMSFNFVLEHPEWDEVLPEIEIPAITPDIQYTVYKVVEVQEQ